MLSAVLPHIMNFAVFKLFRHSLGRRLTMTVVDADRQLRLQHLPLGRQCRSMGRTTFGIL